MDIYVPKCESDRERWERDRAKREAWRERERQRTKKNHALRLPRKFYSKPLKKQPKMSGSIDLDVDGAGLWSETIRR